MLARPVPRHSAFLQLVSNQNWAMAHLAVPTLSWVWTGEEVLRWSECQVRFCGFLSKGEFHALCRWHMELLTPQRLEE